MHFGDVLVARFFRFGRDHRAGCRYGLCGLRSTQILIGLSDRSGVSAEYVSDGGTLDAPRFELQEFPGEVPGPLFLLLAPRGPSQEDTDREAKPNKNPAHRNYPRYSVFFAPSSRMAATPKDVKLRRIEVDPGVDVADEGIVG
jgi:hypothetical protein